MIRNKISKQLYNLLPAYINATLNPVQRKIVAWWLDRNEAPRATAENLKTLQSAVRRQPYAFPPKGVLQQIQTQIHNQQKEHAQTITPVINAIPNPQAALGLPVLFLTLLTLLFTTLVIWQALPPGIVLQWSIEGRTPEAFRVYRAEVNSGLEPGSSNFELIEELPASSQENLYTFTDFRLFPGQNYIYRVEGLNAGRQTAVSQTILGQGVDALPGQIAILLILIFAGISLWRLLQLRYPIMTAHI